MRNKILYTSISIMLLFSGCLVKTEIPRYSKNINDSKENGSFISEYQCSKKVLVQDSIEIKINEAWTEHVWYYKNQIKQIEVSKDTILLMSIDINNEDYLWKAPSPIVYTSESLIGMSFTSIGGNKLKLEYPKYHDKISIIFWGKVELLLTKQK